MDLLLGRVLSVSVISALEPDEKEKCVEKVRRLGNKYAPDNHIVIPYRTQIYWCKKI